MKRILVLLMVAAAAIATAASTKESLAAMKPSEALDQLKQGNGRFLAGAAPRDSKAQVKATAEGQYPFAAVLSCMDSRVPPEIVLTRGSETCSSSAWRATSPTPTISEASSTQPKSWDRS